MSWSNMDKSLKQPFIPRIDISTISNDAKHNLDELKLAADNLSTSRNTERDINKFRRVSETFRFHVKTLSHSEMFYDGENNPNYTSEIQSVIQTLEHTRDCFIEQLRLDAEIQKGEDAIRITQQLESIKDIINDIAGVTYEHGSIINHMGNEFDNAIDNTDLGYNELIEGDRRQTRGKKWIWSIRCCSSASIP